MLAWLSVWSEVQTCKWPGWCHCHSLSLASIKFRLLLPFWYRLTQVVLEKTPLNGYISTSSYSRGKILLLSPCSIDWKNELILSSLCYSVGCQRDATCICCWVPAMLLGICGLCSRVEAVELDLTASVCQLLHFTLPTVTVGLLRLSLLFIWWKLHSWVFLHNMLSSVIVPAAVRIVGYMYLNVGSD